MEVTRTVIVSKDRATYGSRVYETAHIVQIGKDDKGLEHSITRHVVIDNGSLIDKYKFDQAYRAKVETSKEKVYLNWVRYAFSPKRGR